MDNCKELFLEDITEMSIHPIEGCQFPIPSAVAGISSMLKCTLSQPALRIGYFDGVIQAEDGSLLAKCTTQSVKAGLICAFDFSANIEGDSDEIHSLYNKIYNKDHYICIRTREDKMYLCYTLPGTFRMLSPTTIQDGKMRQVNISARANSEFIEISLR